jgi:Spy/CpxP family protein refolding chaperone
MRKTMVALGLAAAVALTATTAFAWGPGAGRGMGMGYGPGQGDRYAEMATVRNELFTKRTELRNLFRESVLDQAKIAAKQKELTTLQAQMQEKGLAARIAVAEVLTPEQRAQMPTFGPGTGPGFGPGRGFGPGMGMGHMGMGPRMGFGPRW